MLRLGLVLVGAAMVLHGRAKSKASQNAEDDATDPGSDPFAPSSQGRLVEPRLDTPDALNPLLIGPPGASLGRDLLPAPGPLDAWDRQPGTAVYGEVNADQVGAAFGAYHAVLGQAAGGIRREISNVRRAYNFHQRLLRKIRHWF